MICYNIEITKELIFFLKELIFFTSLMSVSPLEKSNCLKAPMTHHLFIY